MQTQSKEHFRVTGWWDGYKRDAHVTHRCPHHGVRLPGSSLAVSEQTHVVTLRRCRQHRHPQVLEHLRRLTPPQSQTHTRPREENKAGAAGHLIQSRLEVLIDIDTDMVSNVGVNVMWAFTWREVGQIKVPLSRETIFEELK